MKNISRILFVAGIIIVMSPAAIAMKRKIEDDQVNGTTAKKFLIKRHNPDFSKALSAMNRDMVKSILNDKKTIQAAKDIDVNYAIYSAAQYKWKDIVELLLTLEVYRSLIGDEYIVGELAIMSVDNGWKDIVELLLKHNMVSQCRVATLLEKAVKKGHISILELLLSYEPYKPFISYTWLLRKAIENGQLAIVELILSYEKNTKWDVTLDLRTAAENGHLAIAELLLSFEKNERSITCVRSALSGATKNGHLAIVELLLTHKNTEILIDTSVIDMVLNVAKKTGNLAVVKLLLEHPKAPIFYRFFDKISKLKWYNFLIN